MNKSKIEIEYEVIKLETLNNMKLSEYRKNKVYVPISNDEKKTPINSFREILNTVCKPRTIIPITFEPEYVILLNMSKISRHEKKKEYFILSEEHNISKLIIGSRDDFDIKFEDTSKQEIYTYYFKICIEKERS